MRPGAQPQLQQTLASNAHELPHEWGGVWEEPGALADVACVAGLLGLVAGLLAVLRLSAEHFFPDALFWRALPLLVVLPPACFLGTLLAPGGLLDGSDTAWSRAARLGLGGLASYLAPLLLLAVAASLGSVR
jgi:hypothetical protein